MTEFQAMLSEPPGLAKLQKMWDAVAGRYPGKLTKNLPNIRGVTIYFASQRRW
jgi:hypothetical protein